MRSQRLFLWCDKLLCSPMSDGLHICIKKECKICVFFPVCTQRWGVSACGGQVHGCSSLCLPDVCVPNLLLIWQSCVGARAASSLTVVPPPTHTHTPPPLPFVWHTSNVPLPSWPLKKEPFYPLKLNVCEVKKKKKKNLIKINTSLCIFLFVCINKKLRFISSVMTIGTQPLVDTGDCYLFIFFLKNYSTPLESFWKCWH